MRHIVNVIEDFKERGSGFRLISAGKIDTTSASRALALDIFSALAQLECRLIQKRTRVGLGAAHARGKNGGRPPRDPNTPRVTLANRLYCDNSISIGDICSTLKISKATLYRYVRMQGNRDARG